MATIGIVKTSQETGRVVRNDDEDPYANLSYLHPLNRLPAKTPKETTIGPTCAHCKGKHLGINCPSRSDNLNRRIPVNPVDFEINFYQNKFDKEFLKKEIEYIDNLLRAKFEKTNHNLWREMNKIIMNDIHTFK